MRSFYRLLHTADRIFIKLHTFKIYFLKEFLADCRVSLKLVVPKLQTHD